MGHRQRRLSAEAALGLGGPMPDGGECALDRVRCPDVFPMLGGEVVEGEQVGAVLAQAFHRPVIFHAVSLDEEVEGDICLGFGFGHPDFLQVRLGLGLQ